MKFFHDLPKQNILYRMNVRFASELETLMAIEAHGDLNPIQRSRLEELRRAGSYGNEAGIESPTGTFINQYTPGGTVNGINDPATLAIIAAQDEANKKFTAKIKEFDANNPFVYDKILEDEIKKVGIRLDPYYKQTLDDFLRGINTRSSRSLQDERRTLSDISQDIDAYRKETRMNLEDALSRSREGFADVGQYFSGQQLQTTARQGLESGQRETEYLRGAEQRRESSLLSYDREREDLGEEQKLFQRDVGSYSPEGLFKRGARSEAETRLQAIPEVERRRSQREFEMRQWVGNPPGTDPAQFALQSYSLLR